MPLKKLAPYRADEPKLDARRRRRLREEVKEREKAAEAELQALRAKKKRRGKRKAVDIATAVDDLNGTVGTPSGVTGELAGGKRRRRKKGQKKQRDRKGGSDDCVGEGLGEDVASMVPRVRPIVLASSVGSEGDSGGVEKGFDDWDGEDDDVAAAVGVVAGDSKDVQGKRKKRRKKRSRSSNGGVENAQDGEVIVDEGDVAQAEKDSAQGGGGSVSVARADSDLSEKTAMGKTQVERSGGQDNSARERSTGKERIGNRSLQKGQKKANAKKSKLAKFTGVSKSRLASYGL